MTERAVAERAAIDLLRAMTDAPLDGVWSAPGRVNLVGEHTDYNEGFVLPFAIDRRTRVALARRADGLLRIASTLAEDPVEVPVAELDDVFVHGRARTLPGWAAYPLGVAWVLARRARGGGAGAPAGADVAIASDVPVGAGLSSSAALEIATAVALADTWGLEADPLDLARAGREAENEAVGAPTGIMDQVAALQGSADAAVFLDCRTLESATVPLRLGEAGLEALVVDTRVSHAHAHGGYAQRQAECARGATMLGVEALRDVSVDDLDAAERVLDDVTFRRVRHVVTENQRVLDAVAGLTRRGPAALAPLLTASHASMRDDFEISVPELDTAVEAATESGALAARMTGGGFGGAALAIVPADRRDEVEDAVRRSFASHAFAPPAVFAVVPSPGARRDA